MEINQDLALYNLRNEVVALSKRCDELSGKLNHYSTEFKVHESLAVTEIKENKDILINLNNAKTFSDMHLKEIKNTIAYLEKNHLSLSSQLENIGIQQSKSYDYFSDSNAKHNHELEDIRNHIFLLKGHLNTIQGFVVDTSKKLEQHDSYFGQISKEIKQTILHIEQKIHENLDAIRTDYKNEIISKSPDDRLQNIENSILEMKKNIEKSLSKIPVTDMTMYMQSKIDIRLSAIEENIKQIKEKGIF